ncbi:MAG: NAD-dependent epimerase/dehydratase family protein [bacterium]|nr:epimerase [Deltaproteobacteria bacterium]MCP4241152.1 NAD-dependent epimerase/dehydratase family protein [bacterium]
MKVMVTGGTGFTGSHTVKAFVAAGHTVRLLVRDSSKVRRVFDPHGIGIPEDQIVVGDIVDETSVAEAMKGCDAVFHCAALVDLRRSMAKAVLDTNARGVDLVVGGAVQRGLPSTVYVSSISVFFDPGCPPLHEGLPIAPARTAYGRSKADAERAIRRMQDEGAPIRVSYPTGIAGPEDPGMSGANHVFYTWFVDLGLETSSGFQIVDVRDVAALHRRLLELPEGAHRYPAAGGMLSWAEAYELAERLTGTRIRRVTLPGNVVRVLGTAGDWVKRVYDFNFPLTRDSMEFATQWPGANASRTTDELGVEFRPLEETYTDTLRSLYRAGRLTAAQVGRLADG